MKKKTTLLVILIGYFISIYAQKPSIDFSVYEKWPSIESANISKDSKYILYIINNEPEFSKTLVVKNVKSTWEISLPFVLSGSITGGSEFVLFTKQNDSLGLLNLVSKSIEYIPNVSSFKTPADGQGHWIAYKLNSPSHELRVRNMRTHMEMSFVDIKDYMFDKKGITLLLQKQIPNSKKIELSSVNLNSGRNVSIWNGENISNLFFDSYGTGLFFKSFEKGINSICSYSMNSEICENLISDNSMGLNGEYEIQNIFGFTQNDENLLFSIRKAKVKMNDRVKSVSVDIWNYKDSKLQSQQLSEKSTIKSYNAIINLKSRKVTRIENESEEMVEANGNFMLLTRIRENSDNGEMNWNPACLREFYIFNINTSDKYEIKLENALWCDLSPMGKYLIYYNWKDENYYSYNIEKKLFKNISFNIRTQWRDKKDDSPVSKYTGGVSMGWINGDSAVFLSDHYDIWKVDPDGNEFPIDLTNNWGKTNDISFSFATNDKELILNSNDRVLLSAIDYKTKDRGFFIKAISKDGNAEKLIMGPYIYSNPLNKRNITNDVDNDLYLIFRESETSATNLYVTSNFKNFTPESDVHPEKSFNWYTTELLTWKTLDGITTQGILYKPENFNPKIKYPIIFNYYEMMSDGLHKYLAPGFSRGNIDIASFVSNGYLVLTPDIHYKQGEPGNSALQSILSASKLLSKRAWVDEKKMAIQGHSFGGYETNYIVTHTNIFCAAMSAAGFSDCISDYGDTWGSGASKQGYYELGGGRIGFNFWENPQLYIKNSPIFNVDSVNTPLLLMANKNDGAVSFSQGVQLFTALRRLGKKSWMLQYDGENHIIINNEAARDYSLRLFQFFDYYLKNKSAPRWMTLGVRAVDKGIISGLELDTSNHVP
jgi:dipeptidyl aminopeptidase/acylaminoacyl peptidase